MIQTNEVEEIKKTVKHLENQNKRILFLLESDNKTNHIGYGQRITEVEDRVSKLETFKTTITVKLLVLGVIGGIISAIAVNWLLVLIGLK